MSLWSFEAAVELVLGMNSPVEIRLVRLFYISFFFSALAIAMVTFSCLVNFFIVRISRGLHFCESSFKLLNSNLNYNSHTDRCLVLNRGFVGSHSYSRIQWASSMTIV